MSRLATVLQVVVLLVLFLYAQRTSDLGALACLGLAMLLLSYRSRERRGLLEQIGAARKTLARIQPTLEGLLARNDPSTLTALRVLVAEARAELTSLPLHLKEVHVLVPQALGRESLDFLTAEDSGEIPALSATEFQALLTEIDWRLRYAQHESLWQQLVGSIQSQVADDSKRAPVNSEAGKGSVGPGSN